MPTAMTPMARAVFLRRLLAAAFLEVSAACPTDWDSVLPEELVSSARREDPTHKAQQMKRLNGRNRERMFASELLLERSMP